MTHISESLMNSSIRKLSKDYRQYNKFFHIFKRQAALRHLIPIIP